MIQGKKGKGGKRGCVVVASLDRGERPRIGDYKGAYAPVYWKEPNTPVDYVEKTDEGLLTFSRQKLALIKCEYDPTCCNHCEKYSPADKLKTCDRCRFAKYCSRECQVSLLLSHVRTVCKHDMSVHDPPTHSYAVTPHPHPSSLVLPLIPPISPATGVSTCM